jgi:hypothetical protein
LCFRNVFIINISRVLSGDEIQVVLSFFIRKINVFFSSLSQ